jgi:hypothetical protein
MVSVTEFIFSNVLGQVLFWFLLIVGIFLTFWGVLFYIKKRSLKFTAYEVINLGDGKVHLEKSKAGWMGQKTFIGNLIHVGKTKIMKMKDGRRVRDFSTEDYHQGKKGKIIIVTSDPLDRKTVIPLTKIKVEGDEAFSFMPPIDFRDAVLDNIKQTERELKGFGEGLIQIAVIGFIIIAGLLVIYFNIRFSQQSIAEANDLVKSNSNLCKDAIVQGIKVALSTPSPTAP